MNWWEWEQATGKMASQLGYLGADNALHITNTDMEAVTIRAEEPLDEFTQLSGHKFHELLERFYGLT